MQSKWVCKLYKYKGQCKVGFPKKLVLDSRLLDQDYVFVERISENVILISEVQKERLKL